MCEGDALYLVVTGEDIDHQWLLSLTDELDGLIHTAHTDDGQQWSKDLLLHYFGFSRHILQHSGSCMETGESFRVLTKYIQYTTKLYTELNKIKLN